MYLSGRGTSQKPLVTRQVDSKNVQANETYNRNNKSFIVFHAC